MLRAGLNSGEAIDVFQASGGLEGVRQNSRTATKPVRRARNGHPGFCSGKNASHLCGNSLLQVVWQLPLSISIRQAKAWQPMKALPQAPQ